MAGLKQIKGKIRATDRTRKVTKAMEAVSAVKMRKSQERALAGRAYARAALRILSRVAGSIEKSNHALVTKRSGNKTLVILVTSDKGLAGNLNSAVLKEAERAIADTAKSDVSFIALGKRGYEYFEKRGYNILSHTLNLRDDVSLSDLALATNEALNAFLENRADRVVVIYQNFKSTFEQQPVLRTVLPLRKADIAEIVTGITPEHGKMSNESLPAEVSSYSVEPSEDAVLSELLPRLASVIVYHALLEAKASEHSARMVAMKNASDKARDVSKALNLAFNKARQAAITREVSEITGGIEAMAQQS